MLHTHTHTHTHIHTTQDKHFLVQGKRQVSRGLWYTALTERYICSAFHGTHSEDLELLHETRGRGVMLLTIEVFRSCPHAQKK